MILYGSRHEATVASVPLSHRAQDHLRKQTRAQVTKQGPVVFRLTLNILDFAVKLNPSA